MRQPTGAKTRSGAPRETAGAQTLRRGLAVLKLLARYQPAGLRIGDIGRKTGLAKPTAIRLTRTLLDEKFVSHDPTTRRYRLGPESFAVGLAAEPAYALQRIAAPALRSLASETGDWVFFEVLQGFEVICLSRESGEIPYPATAAVRVGDRHPLGIGAGGTAVIAALPDDELEAALEHNAAAIARDYPRCPPPMIRELVRQTRERGYCVIPGLVVRGYWALGVALVQDDRPVGAIVLVSTAARLHADRRAMLGEQMRTLACELIAQAARR